MGDRSKGMRKALSRFARYAVPAACAACVTLLTTNNIIADTDLPTKFSNQGGIINTRHNLTQSTLISGSPTIMGPFRNDYGEICVYCHTPHGAGLTSQAPLWNRTRTTAGYQTYDTLGTVSLDGTVTNPGPNSLTCLTCHDGTVAIDSIINMPGSGALRYSAAQEFAQNNGFLNGWNNATGPDAGSHFTLSSTECLACHSTGAPLGSGATDLRVMAIGTDLRDDHPIGVLYAGGGDDPDFNALTGTQNNIEFFESNGNGRADTGEIRVYNTGDGIEVECASCHDPHGVPAAGPGSVIHPTFLRVSNNNSGVCLTCHNK